MVLFQKTFLFFFLLSSLFSATTVSGIISVLCFTQTLGHDVSFFFGRETKCFLSFMARAPNAGWMASRLCGRSRSHLGGYEEVSGEFAFVFPLVFIHSSDEQFVRSRRFQKVRLFFSPFR